MTRRSRHFLQSREPFRDNDRLTLQHAEGPFGFLNPTRAHFLYPAPSKTRSVAKTSQHHINDDPIQTDSDHDSTPATYPASNIKFLWRSRDNRKGRHALLIQRPSSEAELKSSRFLCPRRTSDPREVLHNIWRTFTYFPIWDISWLVAFIFTLGSMIWVLNGFFVWLPVVAPSTEFPNEILYGGGITAFIGAIVFFEFGSILLVIEAVNANNAGCFGWAVEQLLDDHDVPEGDAGKGRSRYRITPNRRHCRHHHQNRHNFVGKASAKTVPEIQTPSPPGNDTNTSTTSSPKSWQWFPTLHDLRKHYFHELGFLAGLSQLFGATIFGISGITALPGITDHLEPQYVLNAAYWIPQVIGGSGFIVSSSLYMLETQKKWYIPAPQLLGWHIAFWNLIGALGFTLCGALGMAYGNSGAQYQAGLATFWGSWAFLIGSYLQLYESLDKHPVEEVSSKKSFDAAAANGNGVASSSV